MILPSTASPQELGTRTFTVDVQRTGDLVTTCAINFTQLLQDIEYAAGGFVQLDGRIALSTAADGAPQWRLELTPADLSLTAGQLALTPFKPATAAVRGADFTTAGHEGAKPVCDDAGFCATYQDPVLSVSLMTAVADPAGFQLSYRRRPSGLDVITTIADPSPDGSADLERFSDCVFDLVGRGLAPAVRPPAGSLPDH